MDSMETTLTAPQQTEPTLPPTTPSSSSSSIASTPEILPSPSPSPSPNPNPNPNQNPQPLTSVPQSQQQQQQQQQQLQQQQKQPTLQHSHIRPALNRPRPQQSFTHFGQHLPSLPSSSSSSTSASLSSASPAISTTSMQRGGLAIGVPAVRPPQQPASYSSFGTSSFNQQFGVLGRNPVNVPDPSTNSTITQVRQPVQGVQSMGMMGSHGPGSQLRPVGVSGHPQQRPVQPSPRSQSPSSSQSLASQKFQGHGLLRGSSMGSPGSPSPGTPQSSQTYTQPWMSAGSQGKQMHPSSLPSSSFRPQMKPQSLQQRSHIPQQQHYPMPMASHQQQMTSAQQQQPPSQSHQPQEHYGQQYPPPRVPQSVPHQQPVTRGQGSGNQKSLSLPTVQPTTVQSGSQKAMAGTDAGEYSNQILSKRSIHELVTQIEPFEKLDPEVEDILVEIAEDFVDSITTFACSLAKHRKSTTLEAKDVLLHLERNWNITLPGFGGDEIKSYKKPFANDIHKERLAAIKKSTVGVETANTKSSAGQPAGNLKGHVAKALTIGSPKTSEVP